MRSTRWIRLTFLVALVLTAAPAAAQLRGFAPALPDTFGPPPPPDPPPPPPPPPPLPPYVTRIVTDPATPSDQGPTSVVLAGTFPYPCGETFDARGALGYSFAVGLKPRRPCPETAFGSWRWRFDQGLLRAGHYRIQLALAVVGDTSAQDTSVYYHYFDFSVARGDSGPPIPPRPIEGLRFVDGVRIGTDSYPPPFRPICPGDSIVATVTGRFPNTCYRLRDIQVVPVTYASVLPGPPMVWIQVDSTLCGRQACNDIAVPWTASVAVHPLPAGDYRLQFMESVGQCFDSIPPPPVYFQSFPFSVSGDCGPPAGQCVYGAFLHADSSATPSCDASVSVGRPANVVFGVHSTVALSGLQGEFTVAPAGLRITGLEPVRAAAGMKLSWTRTASGGARFVLFAHDGAPIPPSPWLGASLPVPILRVTLSQSTNQAPDVTWVMSEGLLGSDAAGNAVTLCPIPANVRLDPRWFAARICRERDCDFNGDGRVDVRDLVLMVRCLRRERPCPDSTGIFDCNGDGNRSLDDVMCCARRILGVGPCLECEPDSSETRHEDGIALDLGAPAGSASTLAVPMRLRGSNRVGALRLVLDAPLDRYDVAGVDLGEGGSDWLQLDAVEDGKLVIGLIRLSPAGAQTSLDLTLRLALKAGQTHGGSVTASAAEFSGPDGVALDVDLGIPSQSIGGPARIALSLNRPNPFPGATRFAVTLDRAADVSLGIYDVGGRLVHSIFRGSLPAGTHDFAWSGVQSDGARAASGIYFYRATAGTETVSRKMILMRAN